MTLEQCDAKVEEIAVLIAPMLQGVPHYAVESIMDSVKDKLSGLCLLIYPVPSSECHSET
jgi:hypothetical protein